MSRVDPEVLAERVSNVERHLARVAQKLPSDVGSFLPTTDASDAVILHLWQATQAVVDLAVSTCVALDLGAPASYADAFVRLANAGHLDPALSKKLVKAAGFRNVVAHAYEALDLARVYDAAKNGPADLRAFLLAVRRATIG